MGFMIFLSEPAWPFNAKGKPLLPITVGAMPGSLQVQSMASPDDEDGAGADVVGGTSKDLIKDSSVILV